LPVKIEYKLSVFRDLKKLDRQASERILDKIESVLSNNPNIGEPLKGDFKGLFRYRVGDYRIIYIKTPESILILRIGHRSSVYK
jgi:mRNA interferase RelE/StbE